MLFANISDMTAHDLMVSTGALVSVCTFSAIGGATLKLGADKESWALVALSLVIYSCASLGMYWLYRSGAATSFAITTFIALLGTLLATQVLSIAMGEPFNTRTFAVMIVASAAFAWASQEQATNQTPDISTVTKVGCQNPTCNNEPLLSEQS
ncbi:MAG: hypothetical protein COA69_08600 [Robiginitomaculum sp.]|nr:MAG: hypothetical protein COA69_08600 [Robiginitomaculum sp.]